MCPSLHKCVNTPVCLLLSKMGAFRDEQLQELEALVSVFDGERIKFQDVEGELKGLIQVEFDELPFPLEVSATENGICKSVTISVLPAAVLHFSLSPTYPSTSTPELVLECIWMSTELLEAISQNLRAECENMQGMPTLFFCSQAIVDFVRDQKFAVIHLNDLPYVKEKRISPFQALHLVLEASEQSTDHKFSEGCFDCEVCFDNKIGRECVRIVPCNHVFCFECISAYITEKTRGAKMVGAITCLGDGCESILSQMLIKKAIGEEEFDRYERIVLETALWQMEDVVTCPRPSCQKSVITSQDNPRLGMCHCGYAFCVLCKKIYHGVAGCAIRRLPLKPEEPGSSEEFSYNRNEIVERWNNGTEKDRIAMAKWYGGYGKLQELVDSAQNEDWIENNSKRCPSCGTAIEKGAGCNKMMCTKCKHPFCWLCNKMIPKDNPYSHYKQGECADRLFENTYEEVQEPEPQPVLPADEDYGPIDLFA